MSTVDPVEEIKAHIDAFYNGNQTKFAKTVGISQPYISQVITGKTQPSDRLLEIMGLQRAIIRSGDAK